MVVTTKFKVIVELNKYAEVRNREYFLRVLQNDEYIEYRSNTPIIKFDFETDDKEFVMNDLFNIIKNNKGIKSIKIN